jgi:hypothetical protein
VRLQSLDPGHVANGWRSQTEDLAMISDLGVFAMHAIFVLVMLARGV